MRCPTGLCALVATIASVAASVPLNAQDPAAVSTIELVEWLDDPETQWVATARLQDDRRAALPLLLRGGRLTSGAHGRWTAPMLALAKLGEPAIPAIVDRVLAQLATGDREEIASTRPLIEVLGSLGPRAISGLIAIAEAGVTSFVASNALEAIHRLEPPTDWFGQPHDPWMIWQPADQRPEALEREILRSLPRVRQLLDLRAGEGNIYAPGRQRQAAYLLARWGTRSDRARGLRVLEQHALQDRAHFAEPLRLLYTLRAPQTATLVRASAEAIPLSDELRGSAFLRYAIALHQLGDPDYVPLLEVALRDAKPHVRIDAARFVGRTGVISHAELLIPLLQDPTHEGSRSVAEVAYEALRCLTFQQLPSQTDAWVAWTEQNREFSRATLINARAAALDRVPIWEANKWIKELAANDGPSLWPLIDRYLARADLEANATGPHSFEVEGGTGPIGTYGPRIVTLLLEMTQRAIPGAMERLMACLNAADPDVRMFGALAVAAYDRPRAIEHLVTEAKSSEDALGSKASEYLLTLGDKRGIPARLKALESDWEATRRFACRDIRVYTQQPVPCDPVASPSQREANVAAWRSWWQRNERTFIVKTREAELDLQHSHISPVGFSDGRVQ